MPGNKFLGEADPAALPKRQDTAQELRDPISRLGCSEVEEGLPITALPLLGVHGHAAGRAGVQVGCRGRAWGWPQARRWQGPLGWSASGDGAGGEGRGAGGWHRWARAG